MDQIIIKVQIKFLNNIVTGSNRESALSIIKKIMVISKIKVLQKH